MLRETTGQEEGHQRPDWLFSKFAQKRDFFSALQFRLGSARLHDSQHNRQAFGL